MNSNALPIMQGTEPKEGRKAWSGQWDFTAATQYVKTTILTDIGMPSGIQSMFIDNSNSPAILIIMFQGTYQKVVVPAYSQMITPVLNVGQNFGYTVYSAGQVVVNFQLFNFEQDLSVINAQGTQVQGTVQVSGAVTTTPGAGAFTDRSGQIAGAAASQPLCPVNGQRRRLIVFNPGSTAGQFAAGTGGNGAGVLESIYLNFTAPAGVDNGTSLEIQPGGSYDSGGGIVTTELVTVTAATAAHRYIAKEM